MPSVLIHVLSAAPIKLIFDHSVIFSAEIRSAFDAGISIKGCLYTVVMVHTSCTVQVQAIGLIVEFIDPPLQGHKC